MLSLLFLLPLVACGELEDLDGDGLFDEEAWGTDPNNPDSDGDGFMDGDEVDQGKDPMDPSSHPYTGGWTIDADCNEDIDSTGNGVGQVAEDLVLQDQYGEDWRLHDFCGRTIMLEFAGFT